MAVHSEAAAAGSGRSSARRATPGERVRKRRLCSRQPPRMGWQGSSAAGWVVGRFPGRRLAWARRAGRGSSCRAGPGRRCRHRARHPGSERPPAAGRQLVTQGPAGLVDLLDREAHPTLAERTGRTGQQLAGFADAGQHHRSVGERDLEPDELSELEGQLRGDEQRVLLDEGSERAKEIFARDALGGDVADARRPFRLRARRGATRRGCRAGEGVGAEDNTPSSAGASRIIEAAGVARWVSRQSPGASSRASTAASAGEYWMPSLSRRWANRSKPGRALEPVPPLRFGSERRHPPGPSSGNSRAPPPAPAGWRSRGRGLAGRPPAVGAVLHARRRGTMAAAQPVPLRARRADRGASMPPGRRSGDKPVAPSQLPPQHHGGTLGRAAAAAIRGRTLVSGGSPVTAAAPRPSTARTAGAGARWRELRARPLRSAPAPRSISAKRRSPRPAQEHEMGGPVLQAIEHVGGVDGGHLPVLALRRAGTGAARPGPGCRGRPSPRRAGPRRTERSRSSRIWTRRRCPSETWCIRQRRSTSSTSMRCSRRSRVDARTTGQDLRHRDVGHEGEVAAQEGHLRGEGGVVKGRPAEHPDHVRRQQVAATHAGAAGCSCRPRCLPAAGSGPPGIASESPSKTGAAAPG